MGQVIVNIEDPIRESQVQDFCYDLQKELETEGWLVGIELYREDSHAQKTSNKRNGSLTFLMDFVKILENVHQVAPNRVKVATDGNIFEDKTFFQVFLKIFLFTLR